MASRLGTGTAGKAVGGAGRARLRAALATTAIGSGVVALATGLTAAPALADCVRTGTLVECVGSADTDGYDETVTTAGEDRTVHVATDVTVGSGSAIALNLVGSGASGDGGDIVVEQVSGTISSGTGDAVNLRSDGGDITVEIGGLLQAGNDGVSATGGDVAITVTGEIDAGNMGIYVSYSGDLSVTNAGGADQGISGGWYGLFGRSVANVTIDNDGGVISGGFWNGIFIYTASGDVDVSNRGGSISGGDSGFSAWVVGGSVTLDNRAGAISGGDYGADIYGAGGPVGVDNRDGGSITASAGSGMDIGSLTGGVHVRNNGEVVDGVLGEGGLIQGTEDGLYVFWVSDGMVTIDNFFGGSIVGGGYGVAAYDITGDGAGVAVNNQGLGTKEGSFVAGGSIIGDEIGVYIATVEGGAAVDNRFGGLIAGARGVVLSGVEGSALIDNSLGGRILGTKGAAIETFSMDGAVTIANLGGRIDGATAAIDAEASSILIVNGGALDDAEMLHRGWIVGAGGDGDAGGVILLESAAHRPGAGTDPSSGGAVVYNAASGLISSDAISGPDAYDAEEVGAAAGDVAIRATGGRVWIENEGMLVGRVLLTDEDDVFNNRGAVGWSVSGESDFGEGDDTLNNSGWIRVFGEASLLNLDTFRNHADGFADDVGAIDMVDGVAGGRLTLGGDYHGGLDSALLIDARLGAGGGADLLQIAGAATGTTQVHVSHLGGWAGYDPTGVLVVEVAGGAEGASTFTLGGGPIEAGFFTYDLQHDAGAGDDRWYLRNRPNDHAARVPDLGIATAQLWHQSAAAFADRTAALRTRIGGQVADLPPDRGAGDQLALAARGADAMGLLAAADAGTSAGRAAAAGSGPGLWARAFGAGAGWNDTDQRSWGLMAGVDLPVATTARGAFVLGAMAGYSWSSLDFDATGSDAALRGPSVGAYASYLEGPFHLDALVKADFLSVEYDALGAEGRSDAVVWGARVDTGIRVEIGSDAFVEPRASLAYVRSEIDDFTMLGNTVRLRDGDSLQGLIGARAGTLLSVGTLRLAPHVSADVGYEFLGDATASFDAGGPVAVLGSDVGGVFGQLGAGVDILDLGGGVSAFARADYRFGEELTALSGSLGVRVAW